VNPPPPSSAALRHLADLLDIRGDWTGAADLRRSAGEVDSQAKGARRGSKAPAGHQPLAGVHQSQAGDYASPGEIEMAIRAARARIPWLLRRLLELSVLQIPEAAALARAGIVTMADLGSAVMEGRIKHQFGNRLDGRLRRAQKALAVEVRPINVGRASDILDHLVARFAAACPSLEAIVAADAVRRCEPLVDALVIVGCTDEPEAAIECIATLPEAEDVLHRAGRRLILAHRQAEVDLRMTTRAEYGTVLHVATGPPSHVAAIEARSARVEVCSREEDVYARAGLPYIAPELRQGTDEIEAAAARRLPALVNLKDIRGDLHMHSTYSDGQDTLESMVAGASGLGYEYIAITDHSERAGASRTVTRDALARQRDEILGLRERYPSLAILHGIEVDIMPDGSLDFPDDLLAPLDIVLASLHDDARQNARTLTRRCITAIRHPLVTIITHPANRIVGRRADYPLDFDAVFEAAAETGTALEIDGAPSHLDLDGEHARAAIAAGATVVIDSDCHRVATLGLQMRLGVGTARRGWVESRHVLNTRSLEDVRRFIAAKRKR